MSYFELYKKRLNKNGNTVREKRLNESIATLNRNFTLMQGYKRGIKVGSEDISENHKLTGEQIDVVVRSGTEELKKDLLLRPETKIDNGTYLILNDQRKYIVNTVNNDGILPVAHCYLCNSEIRMKGCPVDFPIYENSTTFGTKGIVDNGGSKFLELDSKTRAYLQFNEYTSRIPLGYRFIFKNKYVFSVTEIDHMVYDHLIMTMKITERHPNDDFENNIAWNEKEIDFSDLTPVESQKETDSVFIDGSSSIRIGGMSEYFTNGKGAEWEVTGDGDFEIIDKDNESIVLLGVGEGIIQLKAKGSWGETVKNIIIG